MPRRAVLRFPAFLADWGRPVASARLMARRKVTVISDVVVTPYCLAGLVWRLLAFWRAAAFFLAAPCAVANRAYQRLIAA